MLWGSEDRWEGEGSLKGARSGRRRDGRTRRDRVGGEEESLASLRVRSSRSRRTLRTRRKRNSTLLLRLPTLPTLPPRPRGDDLPSLLSTKLERPPGPASLLYLPLHPPRSLSNISRASLEGRHRTSSFPRLLPTLPRPTRTTTRTVELDRSAPPPFPLHHPQSPSNEQQLLVQPNPNPNPFHPLLPPSSPRR